MYIAHKNITLSISPPDSAVPINRHYAVVEKNPSDASMCLFTNHIALFGGGYITITERMTFGEYRKKMEAEACKK